MKIESTENKERNEKTLNSNHLIKKTYFSGEEKHLTAKDINALIEKYKDIKTKPTIIGKEPYSPFLAGISDDTWMSVGEEFKDEE